MVLLSVDEQGNLRIYMPVERIVYFDSLGNPIGLSGSSSRCEKSANESYYPTAVICLADDQLSRSTP